MERPYLNEWQKYINEQDPKSRVGSVSAGPVTQTPAGPGDGKAELIKSLTDKMNSMSKDPKFTALSVAQVIYNNCAHWMNKTDIFANRPGEPTQTKATGAPQQ